MPDTVQGAMARGAVLFSAVKLGLRAVGVLSTLLLARLLTPADFGLVAIGVAVIQLLVAMADIGLAQTVIRTGRRDRRVYDTLFTLSLLRGAVLAAVLWVMGPVLAMLYGDPRVAPMFAALAVVALAQSVTNPAFFEFERALDYSREVAGTVLNKVISVVVSVTVALATGSWWALILGYGLGICGQSVFTWLARPYRPRLTLTAWRQVFGFSGGMVALGAIRALSRAMRPLVLGRGLGLGGAGQFQIASQITSMVSAELTAPVARVVFPGIEAQKDNPTAQGETVVKTAAALGAVVCPLTVGIALCAPALVPLLFGQGWDGAVIFLQVVMPSLGLAALYAPVTGLALSGGHVRALLAAEGTVLGLSLPVLGLGIGLGGLTGAAFAIAGLEVMGAVALAAVLGRIAPMAATAPLAAAARSVGATVIMALALVGTGLGPLRADDGMVAILGAALIGGGAYLLAHIALWRWSGRPEGIESAVLAVVSGKRRLQPHAD